MGIPYFKGNLWKDLTRDERFFCSILYSHAIMNPVDFAKWVIDTCDLGIESDGDWDLGFEVCFYRDMLWHMDDSASSKGLPPKRTFDLCLFGRQDIVVIEAKVYEPFDAAQNVDFANDVGYIRQVPGMESVRAHVVGLASSVYFRNAEKHGRKGTLDVFKGRHLTWQDAAGKYGDPLLARADALYKCDQRKLLPVVQQGKPA